MTGFYECETIERLHSRVVSRSASVQECLLYAEALHWVDRCKSAICLLRQVLRTYEGPEVWAYVAWSSQRYGKHRAAEYWFRRVSEDEEGAVRGAFWNSRGGNFLHLEEFSLAKSCFLRSIDLGYELAESYSNLASAQRGMGDYLDALASIARTISLEPTNTFASNLLTSLDLRGLSEFTTQRDARQAAVDAFRSERYVFAIEVFGRIQPPHADDAFAWFAFGESLRQIGRLRQAEVALQLALPLAPRKEWFVVQSRLAMNAMSWGKRAAAESMWRRITNDTFAGEYCWIWAKRADNLRLMESMDLARECVKCAVDCRDVDYEAFLEFARLERACRNYVEANRAIDQALELGAPATDAEDLRKTMAGVLDV